MKEACYFVNNMKLAAKHWESDGIATLGLHGWLDNAATYDRLAPLLPELNLCALDFSGHGLSDHRPEGVRYHYVDNVDDAAGVADALGWEKFGVIGHSMGAGIATYLAAALKDKISHAIFIEGLGGMTNPASTAAETLRQAIVDMKKVNKKRLPIYEDREAAIQMRMRGIGSISHRASSLLCTRGLKEIDEGYTWRTDPRLRTTSAIRLTEEQVRGFIAAIEAPSLLILGERGFKPQTEDFQRRIDAHSNLTVRTIPGGHHLHLEDEVELVADVIREFLQDNNLVSGL